MQHDFVDHIYQTWIQAFEAVFHSILGQKVTAKPMDNEQVVYALFGTEFSSATLVIDDHEICGQVFFVFDKRSELLLVNTMLGTTFTELPPDLAESLVEIANITYGSFKKSFKFHRTLPLVIPTMLSTNALQTAFKTLQKPIILEVTSKIGPTYLIADFSTSLER